jgi:hypothetical protein
MVAVLALLQIGDPFGLRGGTGLLPVAGVALMLGLAAVGRRTGRPRLHAACIAFVQITVFTILGVALSYAVAAQSGPLWDAELTAADQAIGFDSAAVARSLDSSALLSGITVLAYHSLIPQMIVAVVALSATGRFGSLRAMVLAALLSGFATILLSGLVPAVGALIDPATHRHLPASIAWVHKDEIAALRDGSLRLVDLSAMTGIVSFPSYHAALAAIFIWSFRKVPLLALSGSAWGLLTILATPTAGGHYGVDVIAGLLLGLGSLWIAVRVARSSGSLPWVAQAVPCDRGVTLAG